MYTRAAIAYSNNYRTTRGHKMTITVKDAQEQLQAAIDDTIADMGEDAPDEGSIAFELFSNMAYDWSTDVAAEVARREFGFVPAGAPQAVAEAFQEW
jgi:hypothetical protein